MAVFDLLLIAVVLASLVGLITALVQAAGGNFRRSARTLGIMLAGLAIYMTTICMVSLSATQEIRSLGDPDCNDDWCMAPEKAHFEANTVTVEFSVWSRAKRVTQREPGVHPFLIYDRGDRYSEAESSGPPFDQAVVPNEQFTTTRKYHLKPGAATIDLVLRDGFSPDLFVIGASQSLLHPRAIYRLKPGRGPA